MAGHGRRAAPPLPVRDPPPPVLASPRPAGGGDEGGLGAAGALSPGVTSPEVARELREIAEEGMGISPRPLVRSGGWGEAEAAGTSEQGAEAAGVEGGGPKGRSNSRRQAGLFGGGAADAPGGRPRSHWDDDDDDNDDGAGDGIAAIPTLGDGEDGSGYGEGGIGAAPIYQQNRVQKLRDLDKEMVSRFGGNHQDFGGVDLGLLARHLAPFEDCAGEADEHWDSDTLFAEVVAEMQAEADASHE